ncbi:hypothetical protein CC2G_001336 [Coprinopsis cinerea AmutBmut pab1-1]|nr:hypothetical protein CC2G_001336 [Coprinopsis cinerea AmutBmut pab1-1]
MRLRCLLKLAVHCSDRSCVLFVYSRYTETLAVTAETWTPGDRGEAGRLAAKLGGLRGKEI